MSSTKAALKAAKAALDKSAYAEALSQCDTVLAQDPQNYFATLFRGRALDKSGQVDESAKAYAAAIKLKPRDPQAYLGLRELWESQAPKGVTAYLDAVKQLASVYAELEEREKCIDVLNKAKGFVDRHGDRAQKRKVLELMLPTTEYYAFLEGRVQDPGLTYQHIAESLEAEERERVNTLIGERKTRLGARIGQVTAEVKREVFASYDLEKAYREVINWTSDDVLRWEYEEKLLKHAWEWVGALKPAEKAAKRDAVEKMAKDMVVVKHPFLLAWQIDLEWKDLATVDELEPNMLWEYIDFFPQNGLARVLQAFMGSDVSPFPVRKKENKDELVEEDSDESDEGGVVLEPEDPLIAMVEGLSESKQSALAHRIVGEYYLHLEEYESAAETARKSLDLMKADVQKFGLQQPKDIDAVKNTLGTSLVYYQAPKNHPEARMIFEDILTRDAKFTPALIGIGLILEEEENFHDAINFLQRALERDPDNVRVAVEAAWCKARTGDYKTGLSELDKHLQNIDLKSTRSRELRAQTYFRIGVCIWELARSKNARKSRTGAYARFLAAIKTNPNLPSAYTYLGFYYQDYARDLKRARQCFQKAFELSPSEIEAAERLARMFADQSDWDVVELIAQRVIDSGRARPTPGSKRSPISWPFSAMGVVQMNRQEYNQSAVSFLAALRINPRDYHSYIGLGESYHNSGRYNSALKTFQFAEDPSMGVDIGRPEDNWFTLYMQANVHRELGDYDQAVVFYRQVLSQRPTEYGVLIALLQTYNERAWHDTETGFFGRAAQNACDAIELACEKVDHLAAAFNFWKSVADACATFAAIPGYIEHFPAKLVCQLLNQQDSQKEEGSFKDIDHVRINNIVTALAAAERSLSGQDCIEAAIAFHKHAIHACSKDVHAHAVAWYNLGWAEHQAHLHTRLDEAPSDLSSSKKYLFAAMKCFKKAIELEAGNAEFWNALGIVTTRLNPRVSQHSFVRSLHLNDRSVKAWTNLGTLYLLQDDIELAHLAFTRAQSTDPDYPHAWLGEGLIALAVGDSKEAMLHFQHAVEISDSTSPITKQLYASTVFDILLLPTSHDRSMPEIVQPLFVLQQLLVQRPKDMSAHHLTALFLEQIGDHSRATSLLDTICADVEARYEESESPQILTRFAQSKSDLARVQLASGQDEMAIESAEAALNFSEDIEDDAKAGIDLKKVRLSAHLSAGLAHYYRQSIDEALAMFRAALEESEGAADVVNALAEVLWAKGGEREREVAREQLLEVMERTPDHVASVLLLGAIAVLDQDEGTIEAVQTDLQSLRVRDDLSAEQMIKVEQVLGAIASVNGLQAEGEAPSAVQQEMSTAILLAPWQTQGWAGLAKTSSSTFAADMALATATRNVPPHGSLAVDELARAAAASGTAADAQRAILLAPWQQQNWTAFTERVVDVQ